MLKNKSQSKNDLKKEDWGEQVVSTKNPAEVQLQAEKAITNILNECMAKFNIPD